MTCSHYQTVSGIRFHHIEGGHGFPLVMLHGFGSSSQDWQMQWSALSSQHRLLCPDLRGFGATQRNRGPFSVQQFAEDILLWLDLNNIKRLNLLGYSMGGAVALELSLRLGTRLRGLVLVNAVSSFAMATPRKKLEKLVRYALLKNLSMQHLARVIAYRLFPRKDQHLLRQSLISGYAGNTRQVYLNLLETLPEWSVHDKLHDIHAETLVITADKDYTSVEEKQEYVQRMPRARLEVVKQSRHGTPFDQAEEFNRLVLGFLAQLG